MNVEEWSKQQEPPKFPHPEIVTLTPDGKLTIYRDGNPTAITLSRRALWNLVRDAINILSKS